MLLVAHDRRELVEEEARAADQGSVDVGLAHEARERHQLDANPHNLRYLKTKAKKSGHLLDFKEEPLS